MYESKHAAYFQQYYGVGGVGTNSEKSLVPVHSSYGGPYGNPYSNSIYGVYAPPSAAAAYYQYAPPGGYYGGYYGH